MYHSCYSYCMYFFSLVSSTIIILHYYLLQLNQGIDTYKIKQFNIYDLVNCFPDFTKFNKIN